MFSHILLGATDLEAAKRFYDETLGMLGIGPGTADPKGRIWYSAPSGAFGITRPIDGREASGANGGTVGFAATSAEQVEKWHAAGLVAGGSTCENPPGTREDSNLYLAYLRDPSGNKLCAMYAL